MSRKMQLTVKVTPVYRKDLEGDYPNLARALGILDPELVKASPSFYELAGQVDVLLYRHEGTQFSQALSLHKDALKDLHDRAQDRIADRDLAGADKLLYQMEDIFDEMESDLG